ncbi:MAG: AMP-binding protein [Chloroflexi bacterium]|nr:AMP-binding protein [Chloroflexota bacterium]
MTVTAAPRSAEARFPTGDAVANITLHLEEVAANHPDRPAIITTQGQLTFRELLDAADQIGRGLLASGIERGMHTVLLVSPGLDFFALAFGMFRAGVVPVIIDPGIDRAALKQCIAESEPEAFIGVPRAHLGRILFGWGRETTRTLVTAGRRFGWGGYTLDQIKAAGAQRPPLTVDTRANETAAIVFTSGSTGIPKGVIYQHGNLHAQIPMLRETYGFQPGEVDLPTFPMFALFDPGLGMTSVIPDMDFTRPADVDPEMILDLARRYEATNMFGSPALLNTVSRHGKAFPASMKRVVSAGAPVPAETLERMQAILPDDARIWTPYGATEALPVAYINSDAILAETAEKTRQGAGVCIGYPVEHADVRVITITDEAIDVWDDSLEVPSGTVGEITVFSPTSTVGYYNRDEKTRLAKIRGPQGEIIHRMGDLAYFDEQGRLWYCGRKSHRVQTASGTLFTIQVEQVFNTHPAVYRTALVGVGETPVLLVELEKHAADADRAMVIAGLETIGAQHDHTRSIETFLFHPGFPVDIRHNSKIFREKLGPWAAEQLGR